MRAAEIFRIFPELHIVRTCGESERDVTRTRARRCCVERREPKWLNRAFEISIFMRDTTFTGMPGAVCATLPTTSLLSLLQQKSRNGSRYYPLGPNNIFEREKYVRMDIDKRLLSSRSCSLSVTLRDSSKFLRSTGKKGFLLRSSFPAVD